MRPGGRDPRPDAWPHCGAILAGGASTRMGRDKATMTLSDGRTMIECVAGPLAAVTRRIVAVGPAGTLPRAAAHVDDLRRGQGPLAGIEALLASDLDTEYLVCPCDVPLVTEALLRSLIAPSTAVATALRLAGEDTARPLPLRISAAALPAVRRNLDAGRRAVHRLLEEIDIEIVEAPAACAGELVNVNSREELERLAQAEPPHS